MNLVRELIPPILESGLGHTDWLRGPRVSHLNCTSSLAVRLNSDFVSDHESLKFSPAEAPPDALAVGTMDLGASFGQCHLPNQLSSVRLRWLPPDLLMQTGLAQSFWADSRCCRLMRLFFLPGHWFEDSIQQSSVAFRFSIHAGIDREADFLTGELAFP